jgi:hypothetical protein
VAAYREDNDETWGGSAMDGYDLIMLSIVQDRMDRCHEEAEMRHLAKLAKGGKAGKAEKTEKAGKTGQAAQKARIWRRIELAFWKQVKRKAEVDERIAIPTGGKAN